LRFLFYRPYKGFSLVELLITLAIMGVLAALTIPPLFQMPSSNQASKYTSIAKDVAFTVLTAYEQYKVANPTIGNTVGIPNMTPYMNYVRLDTSMTIDSTSGTSITCGSGSKACLVLHNGAVLYYGTNVGFGGTSTTNGFWLGVDPDGTRNNQSSLGMVLTADGRIMSYGKLDTTYSYYSGGGTLTIAPPLTDASWFTGF